MASNEWFSDNLQRPGIIILTVYFMAMTIFLLYSLDKAWPTDPLCRLEQPDKATTPAGNAPKSDDFTAGTDAPPVTEVNAANAAPTPATPPANEKTTETVPKKPLTDLRLLCLVAISGALGAMVHVIRSFYRYVGDRQIKRSWVPMYFLLPFSGTILAVLFFFILRGINSGTNETLHVSGALGYMGIGAIVGMFTEETVLKIQQVAETILGKKQKGKDALDETAKEQ